MTRDEARKLVPGVYRFRFDNGMQSVGVVGDDGSRGWRWFLLDRDGACVAAAGSKSASIEGPMQACRRAAKRLGWIK